MERCCQKCVVNDLFLNFLHWSCQLHYVYCECKGGAGDLTVPGSRELALTSALSWSNCQKGILPQALLEAD